VVRIVIYRPKRGGGEWFAWHPVETECGALVWLERVRREWDANRALSCIHPDDRGEYVGGWRYYL